MDFSELSRYRNKWVKDKPNGAVFRPSGLSRPFKADIKQ